jgi:hypothetical protein
MATLVLYSCFSLRNSSIEKGFASACKKAVPVPSTSFAYLACLWPNTAARTVCSCSLKPVAVKREGLLGNCVWILKRLLLVRSDNQIYMTISFIALTSICSF